NALDGTSAGAARAVLDRILEEEVPQLLALRMELVARLGLTTFASFISPFATFERNTARAWSALTDQCVPEANASLERARAGLEAARAAFDQVSWGAPAASAA